MPALGTKAATRKDVAPSGAEVWKDFLQLLKEQSIEMEKLGRALRGIQEGMINNSPRPVKSSALLCWDRQEPGTHGSWRLATGGREKGEKWKEKKEENVKVQEPQKKEKGAKKGPRRSPPARRDDDIRVSARDGQSSAEILKEMKAKVKPMDVGLEVLTIESTRKEVFLVLKNGGRRFCL